MQRPCTRTAELKGGMLFLGDSTDLSIMRAGCKEVDQGVQPVLEEDVHKMHSRLRACT